MKSEQYRGSHFNSILELKNQLIDYILIVGTALGFGSFIASKFPLSSFVLNPDFFYDIIALTLLTIVSIFRVKTPLKLKANIIIGILFFTVISDLTENGLFTPDPVLMVLIPFITILVYDLATSFIVFAFTATSFLFMGYLTVIGVFEPAIPNSYSNSFFRWVEHMLMYSVLAFVITLFLNSFQKAIYELIRDLKKQNAHLADRQSALTTIIENFPRSYVALIDTHLKIISTGGREFQNSTISKDQLQGVSIEEAMTHLGKMNNQEELKEIFLSSFKGNEHELEVKFGDSFINIKTAPLLNPSGDISTVLVVFENITDRIETQQLVQENLEEKNMMLQEIHHRVKNNLAVVSGLLELQSYQVEDPKSKMILNESTNRIISIAKVHQMLYESNKFNSLPFKTYISELSEIIISSMNDEGKSIDVNINISVQNMGINYGVPLGIIFNELITNSVKYGFHQKTGNKIDIWVKSSNNDTINVVYKDNGVGIQDFESASNKSLGFTLIKSLLQQIEATYQFDTQNQFCLSFSFQTNSDHSLHSL